MGTATGASRAKSPSERLKSGTAARSEKAPPSTAASTALLAQALTWLDDAKAENIVSIDLAGKSTIADYMVIVSGRSDRHVGAIGDQLVKKFKESGLSRVRIEGLETCDWVLIDTGDIIVHVFRPEVREFYKLEKMWSGDRPGEDTTH